MERDKAVEVVVACDVPIAMRDGTVLRGDVYRPDDADRHPVILMRTPYNKGEASQLSAMFDPLRGARAGFAVVVQDTRGRWASEGTFDPFTCEIDDGFDTVEWAASQQWSSGSVGMVGSSYAGYTQWLAAISQPPHLKAIIPRMAPSDPHSQWFYRGGAFELGFAVSWILGSLAPNEILRSDLAPPRKQERLAELTALNRDLAGAMRIAPSEMAGRLDALQAAGYFGEWIRRQQRDEYWEKISVDAVRDRVQIPALSIGGWYDVFLKGTLANFSGSSDGAGTTVAREGQRLLVGPWLHGQPTMANPVGEADFGPESTGMAIDVVGISLRFLEQWLRPERGLVAPESRVRIFVMGANVWRDEDAWPPARAVDETWYLRSSGHANSAQGDGALRRDAASRDEPADAFANDPTNPVPTRGGQLCCSPVVLAQGAFDQRAIAERPDVLVYSSEELTDDYEVTGPVRVILFVCSSAADADFTAKLVDVFPDGYARNLTDGIVRLSAWRRAAGETRGTDPAERIEIDLVATANVFKRGHRIRLEVASSNFPRFHANPGSGAALDRPQVPERALHLVFHDRGRPSALIVPVIRTAG